MSIQYDDFLKAARKITNDPASLEVDLRTAVSRAYYSAYHACLSEIEVDKVKHKNRGEHAKLIRTMLESGNQSIISTGLQLQKCKAKRVKADYLLQSDILIGETRQVVDEVSKICITIKKPRSSGLRVVG